MVQTYIKTLENQLRKETRLSIRIYTQPGCTHCASLKSYLETEGVAFDNIVIGTDISREDVIAKFPGVKQVPIVVINDQWVHNYAPAVENYIAEVKASQGCSF